MNRVLYVIACGAPPARQITRLIGPAQDAGWDVCLLVTPSAARFVDSAALERLTGHPVRSDYKEPGSPDVLPPPYAIIGAVLVGILGIFLLLKWKSGLDANNAAALDANRIHKVNQP